MVSLGAGFKEQHYGIFLVALLSGLAFWIIEGAVKRHQMRNYLRMQQIEADNYRTHEGGTLSTPLIDWSWRRARFIFTGEEVPESLKQPETSRLKSYSYAWLLPHVLLPHVISVVAGGILFLLGWAERLDGMPL